MEITINKVPYTSIGIFFAQDIFGYWPVNRNDNDSWIRFFSEEDPLIILWTLSFFEYNDWEWEEPVLNKLMNYVSTNEKIISFLKIYSWRSGLGTMFIDFVFGLPNGDPMLPSDFWENAEIIIEGQLLKDPDEFEYNDHVFIETSHYENFITELDKISFELIQKLTTWKTSVTY